MATMIPAVAPDSIKNSGEREVYRQLQAQLPKHWVVRHHFPACWLDGHYLRDSESDFLVLAPGKGLLLLEVKSSHGYDCKDGIWYRIKSSGLRESARNPFEQAMSTKHLLVERIARKVFGAAKTDFPGLFGHAVVYPFGVVQGTLPASTEPTLMIAYSDMTHLPERLNKAYEAWGSAKRAALFTPEVMSRVVKFLSEQSQMVPVLAATVDEDERQIEELTRQQYNAFRGILGNPRVHVRGTAGSGKTILASWSARAFAEQKQRTLLVCFNRVLANWLRLRQGADAPFEIRSFFSLCREFVIKAGLPFNVPSEEPAQDHFWTVEAPALFCAAIDQMAAKGIPGYDAVIVDEAQDFHPDWWLPLQLMLCDPDKGRLCVFSDPEQAGVYGKGTAFPEGLVVFQLLENCRNTKRITSYCGNVINQQVVPFRLSPEGVVPEILAPQPSVSERAKAVRKIVVEILEEKILPARIAILSPWRKSEPESALGDLHAIHGKPLQGDDDAIQLWLANQVIWASTIRSFKGLEADCIIVTDVPVIGAYGFSISDLYVAASRAKHRLFVIPSTSEAASQLANWIKPSLSAAQHSALHILCN